MIKESVSEQILDSFVDAVEKDDLFKSISQELVELIRSRRSSKKNITDLFRRIANENYES